MNKQLSLPSMPRNTGTILYNNQDPYIVTIVEYGEDGRETGRTWKKDTREKPAGEWLQELDLLIVPF